MAQRDRHDAPGRKHHVMNRGVSKRVIFPDRAAKRRFIALIACSVRRGELRVEALAILDTHFHMMASTPDGRICYAMMRIMNAYARYFNRRYKRDGSPYRGRFWSYAVRSNRYWRTLIRYIDRNPVKARIVARPDQYPYGSASLFANRNRGPAWLFRDDIEAYVRAACAASSYRGSDYCRVFGRGITPDEAEVVERRLRSGARHAGGHGRIEDLPTGRLAAWMIRKAKLADGLAPWSPIVGSHAVLRVVEQAKAGGLNLTLRLGNRRARDGWPVLTAGLLHDAAGLSCEEVARRLGCSSSTAGRRLRAHRDGLREHPTYAKEARKLLQAALDETYPEGRDEREG